MAWGFRGDWLRGWDELGDIYHNVVTGETTESPPERKRAKGQAKALRRCRGRYAVLQLGCCFDWLLEAGVSYASDVALCIF